MAKSEITKYYVLMIYSETSFSQKSRITLNLFIFVCWRPLYTWGPKADKLDSFGEVSNLRTPLKIDTWNREVSKIVKDRFKQYRFRRFGRSV